MSNSILMYCHYGSGNHGCEAIIRSTIYIINQYRKDIKYNLISANSEQDTKYGVNLITEKIYNEINPINKKSISFLRAFFRYKILKDYAYLDRLAYVYPYESVGKDALSLSIGGDNYCYGDYKKYIKYHKLSLRFGQKTILWGCSIEPDMLDETDLLEDLKSFKAIFVRESITFEALQNKKLNNIYLFPDPAFNLQVDEGKQYIVKENTVGINISPIILNCEKKAGVVLNNYIELIRYILEKTEYSILFVPHVVTLENDDRIVIEKLKNVFKNTQRITVMPDGTCCDIKGYISKCRFFIGARTHATVAAYSSCVPTIVTGYSVKARGIARDIFGSEEKYVVPVQKMENRNELTMAFKWLEENESNIRMHLQKVMPNYCEKSRLAGKKLMDFI